jgi:hypothetical protein
MRKDENQVSPANTDDVGFDLRALLRPTECFSSPEEVLENEALDISEKRAILASWASDLYAIDSVPALRQLPGSHAVVAVKDILAALRKLDGAEIDLAPQPEKRGRSRVSAHLPFKGKLIFPRSLARAAKNFADPLELRN